MADMDEKLKSLLLKTHQEFADIKYSVYRTALKIGRLRKVLKLDRVEVSNVLSLLSQPLEGLSSRDADQSSPNISFGGLNIVTRQIYAQCQTNLGNEDVFPDVLGELMCALIFHIYCGNADDAISLQGVRTFFIVMCNRELISKYKSLYWCHCEPTNKTLARQDVEKLLGHLVRITAAIHEQSHYENIRGAVESCFSQIHGYGITEFEFVQWLLLEPQSVVWIPTMHRFSTSESSTHHITCANCNTRPITGMRFRCLRCLDYNLCQKCFLGNKCHKKSHKPSHPIQEYVRPISRSDSLKDLARTLRNIVTKRYKSKTVSQSYLAVGQSGNQNEIVRETVHEKSLEMTSVSVQSRTSPHRQNLQMSRMSAGFADVSQLADQEKEQLEQLIERLDEERRRVAATTNLLSSSQPRPIVEDRRAAGQSTPIEKERLRLKSELQNVRHYNRELEQELEKLRSNIYSDEPTHTPLLHDVIAPTTPERPRSTPLYYSQPPPTSQEREGRRSDYDRHDNHQLQVQTSSPNLSPYETRKPAIMPRVRSHRHEIGTNPNRSPIVAKYDDGHSNQNVPVHPDTPNLSPYDTRKAGMAPQLRSHSHKAETTPKIHPDYMNQLQCSPSFPGRSRPEIFGHSPGTNMHHSRDPSNSGPPRGSPRMSRNDLERSHDGRRNILPHKVPRTSQVLPDAPVIDMSRSSEFSSASSAKSRPQSSKRRKSPRIFDGASPEAMLKSLKASSSDISSRKSRESRKNDLLDSSSRDSLSERGISPALLEAYHRHLEATGQSERSENSWHSGSSKSRSKKSKTSKKSSRSKDYDSDSSSGTKRSTPFRGPSREQRPLIDFDSSAHISSDSLASHHNKFKPIANGSRPTSAVRPKMTESPASISSRPRSRHSRSRTSTPKVDGRVGTPSKSQETGSRSSTPKSADQHDAFAMSATRRDTHGSFVPPRRVVSQENLNFRGKRRGSADSLESGGSSSVGFAVGELVAPKHDTRAYLKEFDPYSGDVSAGRVSVGRSDSSTSSTSTVECNVDSPLHNAGSEMSAKSSNAPQILRGFLFAGRVTPDRSDSSTSTMESNVDSPVRNTEFEMNSKSSKAPQNLRGHYSGGRDTVDQSESSSSTLKSNMRDARHEMSAKSSSVPQFSSGNLSTGKKSEESDSSSSTVECNVDSSVRTDVGYEMSEKSKNAPQILSGPLSDDGGDDNKPRQSENLGRRGLPGQNQSSGSRVRDISSTTVTSQGSSSAATDKVRQSSSTTVESHGTSTVSNKKSIERISGVASSSGAQPQTSSSTIHSGNRSSESPTGPAKTRPKKPHRNPNRRKNKEEIEVSSRSQSTERSMSQSDSSKKSKDSNYDAKKKRKQRRKRQAEMEEAGHPKSNDKVRSTPDGVIEKEFAVKEGEEKFASPEDEMKYLIEKLQVLMPSMLDENGDAERKKSHPMAEVLLAAEETRKAIDLFTEYAIAASAGEM